MVADRPVRRELLSLYMNTIKQNISKIDHILTMEVSVFDMQVDNYSETAIYPVLFRKMPNGNRSIEAGGNKKDENEIPFLQVALLQEKVIETGTITIKYLTARVLEFAVELDSGSILLLLTDVWGKVKFLTPDQALSFVNPQAWITRYNRQITSPIMTRELTNVYEAQCMTQTSRILFEQLVLHPIKVSLTFMQTDLPTGREESLTSSNALDMLVSVATVNSLEIRLNSFIVNNVVESISSLQARVLTKTIHDITGQLAQIVGSLQVIGNPANLVSNIGNGVQDFFYEPYQGMVQSPVAFIQGVHKGTTSLVSGVVSGTLTSAAALVGTASSGISYLSGDQDFVRQRAMQRQKQQATRGGALTGIKDGGESFITGIASGISGIVMKPIEGAEKEGALGFFKGVGKGLVGVAVKPVLGVTDGITSIVEGISNEVGNVHTEGYIQLRPKRTFKKSTQNPSLFVLCGVSLDAAEAQQFVEKYALKKELLPPDIFLGMMVIDGRSDIIMSENFIHHRQEPEPKQSDKKSSSSSLPPLPLSKRKCFSVPWYSVAYALLLDGHTSHTATHGHTGFGVEVSILPKDARKPQVPVPWYIPCKTQANAILVYSLFIQNKHKMRNADLMKDATATVSGGAKQLHHAGSSVATSVTSSSRTFAFSAPPSDMTSTAVEACFRQDHIPVDSSGSDSGSGSGSESESGWAISQSSALQRGQTVVLTKHHGSFQYTFSTANNVNLLTEREQDIELGILEGGDGSGIKSTSVITIPSEKTLPTTEMTLLSRVEECLRHVLGAGSRHGTGRVAAMRSLDQGVWWLLFKWHQFGFARRIPAAAAPSAALTGAGGGSPASVCCSALLINHSKHTFHLRRADVVLGRGVWMLCGSTDNSGGAHYTLCTSSEGHGAITIPPLGFALTFVTAATASTYESGNLEVTFPRPRRPRRQEQQ